MDDSSSKNTKQNTPTDPPLVDVKVTNPVTYFKKVWAKIIGNEGVDFRFHIKPLTAFIIAGIIAAIGFGVGGAVIEKSPEPSTKPTSTPQEIWKETAYKGDLQYSESNKRYYLITSSSSEAITLEIPSEVDVESLIGKRILAIGDYAKSTKILKVTDIQNLEVLPSTPVPVPTLTPTPTTSPTNSPTQTSSPTPSST